MIYTLKKEIQGDDLADGYKVVMLKNECWQYIIYIKSIAHNNMICRRKKKKRFITIMLWKVIILTEGVV